MSTNMEPSFICKFSPFLISPKCCKLLVPRKRAPLLEAARQERRWARRLGIHGALSGERACIALEWSGWRDVRPLDGDRRCVLLISIPTVTYILLCRHKGWQ
jgi:hypothetical protein